MTSNNNLPIKYTLSYHGINGIELLETFETEEAVKAYLYPRICTGCLVMLGYDPEFERVPTIEEVTLEDLMDNECGYNFELVIEETIYRAGV